MNEPGKLKAGEVKRKPINLARSGPYFVGLLLTAFVAFWPSYLSQLGENSAYTHVHAVLATLWILMLIAQPTLIRKRRRDVHRTLGRISYGLAPLVVVSIVLLAHSRIADLSVDAFQGQTYFLYLQTSLAALFAGSYAMAIRHRGDMALHARFMICTGFTLVDPVVIRLMGLMDLSITWNRQWFTFGLTDAIILALIFFDRGSRRGRWVLLVMLPLFVLSQLPALLDMTGAVWWQAFARWFAALPLT